jgi:hypothetical protein
MCAGQDTAAGGGAGQHHVHRPAQHQDQAQPQGSQRKGNCRRTYLQYLSGKLRRWTRDFLFIFLVQRSDVRVVLWA